MITFLTTEHFTLQGARSSSVAEVNSRLQIYMGFVSMAVLALALVAQLSNTLEADAFFAFAFVLLPVAYIFGLATGERLNQAWAEWFVAGQGMSRIRRFFIDVTPEASRYLTFPSTDEPIATLSAIGIRVGGRLGGFVTAYAVVAIVNSIVAGVFAGLVVVRLSERGVVAAAAGGVVFLTSLIGLMGMGRRRFLRIVAAAEVRFPADTEPTS